MPRAMILSGTPIGICSKCRKSWAN
ncbi:hypothetical protein IM737_05545 [Devosia sp. SL43]|nr:hypothetical protein IM737_05545 [Devosia sp. SL43]